MGVASRSRVTRVAPSHLKMRVPSARASVASWPPSLPLRIKVSPRALPEYKLFITPQPGISTFLYSSLSDVVSVLVAERKFASWIGLKTTATGREWLNGASLNYTYWMPGHPLAHNPVSHSLFTKNKQTNSKTLFFFHLIFSFLFFQESPVCTYVNNLPGNVGRWSEASCDKKMGFICQTGKPAFQH